MQKMIFFSNMRSDFTKLAQIIKSCAIHTGSNRYKYVQINKVNFAKNLGCKIIDDQYQR
jgi:hypothetical protein